MPSEQRQALSRMAGSKSVLVTGANRGIGLELCRQLHERGGPVIACCRSSNAALDALGVRVEAMNGEPLPW